MNRKLTLLGLSVLIALATSCADAPGEADSVEKRGATAEVELDGCHRGSPE